MLAERYAVSNRLSPRSEMRAETPKFSLSLTVTRDSSRRCDLFVTTLNASAMNRTTTGARVNWPQADAAEPRFVRLRARGYSHHSCCSCRWRL